MLTVKEAAERLGVSPSLVYSLIAARKIEHVRVGLGRGVLRLTEEAIVAYQRRNAVEVVEEEAPRPVAVRRPALKHLKLPTGRNGS